MRTLNLHFHWPHLHWSAHAPAAEVAHLHEHHSPEERLQRFEGSIDVLALVLAIALAFAMMYGLLTATGHPAYFDRWPG